MPVIVHLSDVHFGAHSPVLVESLVADVAAQSPDLVVVTGDLTQRARRDQFAAAQAFLARLPQPVLTVVGNHDLPLFNLPGRLMAPTRLYRLYIADDLDPVIDLPGLAAVGLDTMPAWRWKAGHVSPRQVALVAEALGPRADGAWRLLATHHPLLPPGLSAMAGRDPLIGACARAGVSVLLSGHTHVASADLVTLEAPGIQRSAVSVVAGTAASTRTRGTRNAYAVLNLCQPPGVGGTLSVQARRPAGSGWEALETRRFKLTLNGMADDGDRP